MWCVCPREYYLAFLKPQEILSFVAERAVSLTWSLARWGVEKQRAKWGSWDWGSGQGWETLLSGYRVVVRWADDTSANTYKKHPRTTSHPTDPAAPSPT